MRLWVVAAAVVVTAGVAAGFLLPLNGVLNLPVVVGPGPLIVALLWALKGVSIGAFFLLTRKVVPVVNGEGKKKYIPYVPSGPFLPPGHPLVKEHEKEQYEAKEEPEEPKGYEPKGYEPKGYEPKGYEPKGYEPKGHDYRPHGNGGHVFYTNGGHGNNDGGGHGHTDNGVHGPEPPGNGHENAEVSSYSHLRKRSLQDLQEEGSLEDLPEGVFPDLLADMDGPEEMLWTTALSMDITGCSLKLLCHLQAIPQASTTLEEAMLVLLFNNGQQYAAPQGPPDCTQEFQRCPMSAEELRFLMHSL